jgi:glutaredoxin-like protein NrdH
MNNMTHIEGRDKGNIKLFALSTCVWCKKTRKLLEDLGVDYYYTYLDLAAGDESKVLTNELSKWNPKISFPTLVINNDKCIIGFVEENILEELSDD